MNQTPVGASLHKLLAVGAIAAMESAPMVRLVCHCAGAGAGLTHVLV